ncbi:hypothetical protein KJ567_03545 [Candidatus Bipolaricaulota bacterium]|nr:hypothetical protein [Candidatus Bipolaricaulota bacterium]
MLEWLGFGKAVGLRILIASAAMFGLGVIAVPLLILRIPADYFAHSQRDGAEYPRRHRWFRWIWLLVKNLLGLACLFFGALMLVLPGQGILTILIGVMLLDFPGKYRLQRWVVSRRGVLDSINWMRRRYGRDPLILG